MKNLIALIIFGALVVSGNSQTRNVLVGTNNAVVQPTNFWSADVTNARSGLGLGSAATNPASAFQPSSATLSNLAASNGADLTNLAASNVVGALSLGRGGTGSTNASDARTALGLGTASTNPASAFQAYSANLTNLAANNAGSLTNLTATSIVGIIPSSNIPTINFTNISGTLSIASGGTGATNAANSRQNLGSTTVGDALFTATNEGVARTAIGATTVGSGLFTLSNPDAITFLRINADNTASSLSSSDFRTAIGLDTAATNPATAFQPASSVLTNLAASNGGSLTNITASNVTGTIAISNGGSGATTAGVARTNLGLGATWLTNTDVTNFRTAIGVGATNDVVFNSMAVTNAAATRTNLGLGWTALTNTTASGFQTALFGTNTNPVLVNTNGEVVSPTNFWQVAPIVAQFIESQPTANSTTNIVGARLLHIHSLDSPWVPNVTNTIVLPTNGTSFAGDVALVVHQGPTNTMTRVRQAGSTNDLITMTRFDEAVEFVYYENEWQFNHNVALVEPIYFSGTNAAVITAQSRTNLGLGATWLTNTDVTNFRTAIGLGATNEVAFDVVNTVSGLRVFSGTNLVVYIGEDISEFETQLYVGNALGVSFSTNNSGAAATRTNLGIPLAALTNTNNANFQAAIFNTNSVPTNSANVNTVNFNTAIHWMEVNVVTNGVTNNFRIPLFQ